MGGCATTKQISRPRRGLSLAGAALALTMGLTGLAGPAAADPPYWAPAYGWHRHHEPVVIYAPPPVVYVQPAPAYYYPPPPPVVYAAPPPVYRPAPRVTCDNGNTVVGALIGAGVGGLLGSQAGHGSGKAAATGAGVLAGAIVGGALGQSADRANGCY